MKVEHIILNNLIHDEVFLRKVAPFLQPSYFDDHVDRALFETIAQYFDAYNAPPSVAAVQIELSNRNDLTSEEFASAQLWVESAQHEKVDHQWLVDTAEKFCKDKSVYNAILQSIQIMEGNDKVLTKDGIPKLLSDALAVSFDTRLGHDYIADADERFEFYHRREDKIRFGLTMMNKITSGGLSKKSLNVVLAGTGVGKSLFMCDFAASALKQGKHVLYITMEMAEERISERIDANLMGISMDELKVVDKTTFNNRIADIAKKTQGTLIIKEYPTASAHAGHFRALIEELKAKRNFVPDVLIVDYLNICASSRLKAAASANIYVYVKSIAEELRGLAVEYDFPILTATQTNREGFANSDPGLTNTSESFGLPATADLMFALVTSEELEALNQLLVKQLKNRYADLARYKKFVIGVDRDHMKLYDVEDEAHEDLVDSGHDIIPPRSSRAPRQFDDFQY